MSETVSFEHKSHAYVFKPPVPHNREYVSSLAELTAIALVGSDEDIKFQTKSMQMFVDSFDDQPVYLANILSGLLSSTEYTVQLAAE